MKISIAAAQINGQIAAPTSKSMLQRVLALALLHAGETIIQHNGFSNDDRVCLNIIEQCGASIQLQDNIIKIKSENFKQPATINVGESGLALRMFTPILAGFLPAVQIIGEGSLLNRPMNVFYQILPALGVEFDAADSYLPFKLKGLMQPKNLTIDGAESSQYLTGLLIAFAKFAGQPVTIQVQNLKSKPYVDITLHLLMQFGYSVTHNNYQTFTIKPGNVADRDIHINIEGDWSSASCILAAGAISGQVTVNNLLIKSLQADVKMLDVLQQCGAGLLTTNHSVTVSAQALTCFEVDATHCPDLFPALVVLAAACTGTSKIRGVSRLKYKESNRANTLQSEFGKLGLDIKILNDVMHIAGDRNLQSAVAYSHNDHRIAMALSVAALLLKEPLVLQGAEAVNKSYPGFYRDLQQLGFAIQYYE